MEQLTIDTVKNYKKPKKNTTEARSSDRQIAPVRLRRPGEPNSGELRRRQIVRLRRILANFDELWREEGNHGITAYLKLKYLELKIV